MESIDLFLSMDGGYGKGPCSGSGEKDCSGSVEGYSEGLGSGFCSGDGFDDGSGDGSGEGYAEGSGKRSGKGYGEGTGFGSCILSINNNKVYVIDYIPTIIYHIKSNIARGAILRNNMTLKDCYISKVSNYFAHGNTASKAYAYAKEKMRQ